MAASRPRKRQPKKSNASDHHNVYVVLLRNPAWPEDGLYVGMTGLTPEERFANHKNGIKAAGIVRKYGVRLEPKHYAHLNPMPYEKAVKMEAWLFDSLKKRGYKKVYGGH